MGLKCAQISLTRALCTTNDALNSDYGRDLAVMTNELSTSCRQGSERGDPVLGLDPGAGRDRAPGAQDDPRRGVRPARAALRRAIKLHGSPGTEPDAGSAARMIRKDRCL